MDMWLIGLQDITYREIRIYPKKSCSHPQFGSIWRIEGAKLKTDDGNSLGNLHASRKLKVIFLVASFPHLLNLLDSPLPFLLLPCHSQATLLNALATRGHSIKPGVIELFMALFAEVVTLVLEDCSFSQLIGTTLNLALDALLAESLSICCVNPIVWVDASKTGWAHFHSSPLSPFLNS